MKKFILFSILAIGYAATAYSQEVSKNALGLRLGDGDGFGAEISYQRGISANNRLEFDLGWRDNDHYDAFRLTGLYQWVFPIEGDFNWYVGAGGGLGGYDHNDDYFNDHGHDDGGVYGFIAGDIGVEYDFNFPLLLSLDFRPEIGFGDFDDSDFDFDIALGIRYQF